MDMMQDVIGPVGDCMKGPRGPKGPDAFDDFQYKANQLINKLGLTEWYIEFAHEKLPDDAKVETRVNRAKRYATLVLDTGVEGNRAGQRYAIMAVCNVLFADLDCLMQRAANIAQFEREAAQNAIIRRLTNVM